MDIKQIKILGVNASPTELWGQMHQPILALDLERRTCEVVDYLSSLDYVHNSESKFTIPIRAADEGELEQFLGSEAFSKLVYLLETADNSDAKEKILSKIIDLISHLKDGSWAYESALENFLNTVIGLQVPIEQISPQNITDEVEKRAKNRKVLLFDIIEAFEEQKTLEALLRDLEADRENPTLEYSEIRQKYEPFLKKFGPQVDRLIRKTLTESAKSSISRVS